MFGGNKANYKMFEKFNVKDARKILGLKKNKEKIIEEFVNDYQKEFCRLPSIQEIKDNMENKVSSEILRNYLSSKNWIEKN